MGDFRLEEYKPRTKFGSYIKDLTIIYLRKKVSRQAAALAYFLTLSIFPTLICIHEMLVHFLPLTDINFEEISILIPIGTLTTIQEYMEYITVNSSNAMLIAGILGMLTASAAAYRTIHHAMAEIHGEPRFQSFFATIFSFFFSILFLAAIYFAVIVMATGSWLLSLLEEISPPLSALGIWNWLRFPSMLVIFIMIIYGLYKITSPKNVKTHMFPGAILASLLLVGVSAIFSSFVGISAKYPLIYASFASFIILIFWLYVCGQILLMGNAFNVVLRRHSEEKEKNNNSN